jgi:hypothetical protein
MSEIRDFGTSRRAKLRGQDGADQTRAADPREKGLVDLASAHRIEAMAGQGSAGNVLAALCSFFIPGLGQLLQGRLLIAIVQFCLAAILWFVLLGWIIHLWSILDAALFKPGK